MNTFIHVSLWCNQLVFHSGINDQMGQAVIIRKLWLEESLRGTRFGLPVCPVWKLRVWQPKAETTRPRMCGTGIGRITPIVLRCSRQESRYVMANLKYQGRDSHSFTRQANMVCGILGGEACQFVLGLSLALSHTPSFLARPFLIRTLHGRCIWFGQDGARHLRLEYPGGIFSPPRLTTQVLFE